MANEEKKEIKLDSPRKPLEPVGEHHYRPDDDVGEGLVCLGSRDYTPVLKDE